MMAKRETRRMDKAVHDDMMRLLRERMNDPTLEWFPSSGASKVENSAGIILQRANLFNEYGMITLAGMDYYRKETANRLLTWLRANGFAVAIAGCTIGVSVWGIVGG